MMSQAARLAMSLDAEAARLEKDPVELARSKKAAELAAKWEHTDKDLRAMVKRNATMEIATYAESFANDADDTKRFLKKCRLA